MRLARDGRLQFFGVVHLPALPGSPLGERPLADVEAWALADARALRDGGCDGCIVENLGDRPYNADAVEPFVVAAMTRIVGRIRAEWPQAQLGVNVLRNDARSALSIAAATGADFIRVNVHTGVMVTDQGVIAGQARETVLLRRRLGADVAIAADIDVKHAAPLAPRDLTQEAKDTWRRACADALLVTGSGTGQPVDVAKLRTVRDAVPDAPIWVASGVTPDSLDVVRPHADGVVVGTWLHEGADLDAPVDVDRVRTFAAAIGRQRS
jgi:membrane complex biogenesis BtpA family protein